MNSAPTPLTPSPLDEESSGRPEGVISRMAAWAGRHPRLAILLVSLLAVAVNCYPVIFCGRSFVSPSLPMVYTWWPTLPGQAAGVPISQHGSDTGAMMIGGVPMGFIEARSLWQDGTLPLWNRYGHAGSTLIGQAISMLGDPLQGIVILGHGVAGAWDLKFLTAKVLFCTGFGLLIFRLLGNCGLSLLYAALAAYCGAFFYINNHLVFFVFTYAPWVLLAAIEFLDASSRRLVPWGLVWLAANVACFNAGHVEVAVVLIGGLNLAALAHAMLVNRKPATSAVVLGRMAVGTVLFLALTAPVWMAFLGDLPGAYSVHSEVKVMQLPPRYLPGVFDDWFYHLLLPANSLALAPGSSLLVFTGCLLSLLYWQELKATPFWGANIAAILLWGSCVYGGVPEAWLEHVPLMNRVGHNYTDFSYLLIFHLTIQSAFGFKALAAERQFSRSAARLAIMALGLVAMLVGFCLINPHRPMPWSYFLCAAVGAVGAPSLFVFLKSRRAPISMLGWTAILLLGLAAQFRFGFYRAGDWDMLMFPGRREVLNPPSPAIDWVKADRAEPFRVVGMDVNLHGDYAAVYGLEDIRSCAPLTSGRFMELLLGYPGFTLQYGWTVKVADPVAAQPMLNLLNVKYLLGAANLGLQPGLDFRVAERSDFGVLENMEVWPRAFFVDHVVAIAANGEFLNYLWAHAKSPFVALTPEVLRQESAVQSLVTTNGARATAATHYELLPNSTAFDIHADSAGVVCLTENQARDFVATANGAPRAVLTVNRAFKGLYLSQPGDYHIVFTYRPFHWRLACGMFWLAVGGVVALTVREWVRRPWLAPKS